MDLGSKVETERLVQIMGKVMVWVWEMVAIVVMLIFQLLIWEICQSHRREHPMNLKCQEMKVKVALTLVKTKCEILHIRTKWEVLV